jgi:phosphoglycolate phosphatase-like HAD superfamily hydrolase
MTTAFLFDIDGTLILSGGAGSAAMLQTLAEEFGVPAPQKVPMSGRTDRLIVRDLLQLHGIDWREENWRRFVGRYLRQLPRCLAERQGEVLPGIAPLLSKLADRDDAVVGLLTGNIRDGARIKLGHYGLYHYFPFGGFGDEHLDRNDVARSALAALGDFVGQALPLDNVWVIGDTPLDISCARAVGVRVAGVATGDYTANALADAGADLVLESLADAEPLLALCNGG